MLSVVQLFLITALCVLTVNAPIGMDAAEAQKLISNTMGTTQRMSNVDTDTRKGYTNVSEAPRPSTDIGYAEPGKLCWNAALLGRYTGDYICGGLFIGPQWIMTAAHCIQGRVPSEITVRLGKWDVNLASEIAGLRDYAVHNMSFHPNFDMRTLEYDLVLLMIDTQPVNTLFSDMCIAWRRPLPENFTRKICAAAGWGRGGDHTDGAAADYSSRQRPIPVRVLNDFECEARLRTAPPGPASTIKLPVASFLCASAVGRRRVCRGEDSSGALVCKVNDYYHLAGFVVSGFGCATDNGFSTLFVVNLERYQSWIDDVMWENSDKKPMSF